MIRSPTLDRLKLEFSATLIRQFLEGVAQGTGAVLLIHDEGHDHFIRAGETSDAGLFRLAVWNTFGLQSTGRDASALTLAFDVMTERDAFARSFYQAIIEIWGLPDDLTFRRAWFNFDEDEDPYEDEHGLARTLPEVRSPALVNRPGFTGGWFVHISGDHIE